jgi:hypothetical protein
MSDYYFQKALREDLPIGDFLNVIRICLGKSPTHNGVDGDEHYASVAKRERQKNQISKLPDIEPTNEIEEENEVKEIIEAYKNPTPVIKNDNTLIKLSAQLKRDNKYFDLLEENSIEDNELEFDYGT